MKKLLTFCALHEFLRLNIANRLRGAVKTNFTRFTISIGNDRFMYRFSLYNRSPNRQIYDRTWLSVFSKNQPGCRTGHAGQECPEKVFFWLKSRTKNS